MATYTASSPNAEVEDSAAITSYGKSRRGKNKENAPAPTWMSNILPLNLEENPASGRGRYSSVSVLEPVMRIERSGGLQAMGELTDESTVPCYRIVVTFMFEVAISGFDRGFQKHNRFFDSVSLRYLFRQGDEIDLRPVPDSALHGIQVTNTRDKSKAVDAGVSAGMTSVAAPNLSVQAQRDFKLTYQRNMNSWRMGQSFEPYPLLREGTSLPFSSLLAARLLSQSSKASSKDRSVPRQDRQQHFFQVLSPHAPGCHCRSHFRAGCPLQRKHVPRHRRYNRAANWFWQTEASLRLWTPEIYSSFRCPITVMREVPVATIESIRHLDDLRPYLHFDFEVDTQLRVLGFGLNFFRGAGKPAEMRAQSDTGTQLPPDHIRFCVTCCAENINWPRYSTRNLQAEAEKEALAPGPRPLRLQTNAEFGAWLKNLQSDQGTNDLSRPSKSGQANMKSPDSSHPLSSNPSDKGDSSGLTNKINEQTTAAVTVPQEGDPTPSGTNTEAETYTRRQSYADSLQLYWSQQTPTIGLTTQHTNPPSQ